MKTVSTEDDLWTLFSDSPDQPGHSVLCFRTQLRLFLDPKIGGKSLALTDTTKRYHLYVASEFSSSHAGARTQAIVTQANLRRVGMAMQHIGKWVYVQYLGSKPSQSI